MNDKSLEKLYHEHQGKVAHKWSLYLEEYERLFSRIKNKPINILEIGIQNGGSLEIWGKYFPKAQNIVGCDINPDCANLSYDDSRVAIVIGDANTDSTEDLIVKCSARFDVIIDDGSHISGDIIKSFARYFQFLDEGGVFVAEDLHCSYWEEYGGGLFDPFSSVTFFKRLADIISHEHWGVDKNRFDILKGFSDKYNVQFNEELLQHIHSVEFINSMCVIRKGSPDGNLLGARFIAGIIEETESGLFGLQSKQMLTPSQIGNYWSERSIPPDEEFFALTELVKELDKQVVEQGSLLAELYNSNSWRITRPFRSVSNKVKRVFAKIKLVFKQGEA